MHPQQKPRGFTSTGLFLASFLCYNVLQEVNFMRRLSFLFFMLVLLAIPAQAAGIELDETFSIDALPLCVDAAISSVSLPEEAVFDNDNPGYGAQLEDTVALAAYQALAEQLSPSAEYISIDLSAFHLINWNTEVYPSLQAALSAYVFDHPEMQYCSIKSYGRSGDTAVYIVTHREDGQARKEALDQVLADFVSQFDITLPVVEQYKAIHDHVCDLASYNYKAAAAGIPSEAHTAYGLLVDGDKVVCEGYSKSFKLLCDAVGLPCLLIAGEGNQFAQEDTNQDGQPDFSGISNHMWNAVRLENAWYAVDTTWDDVDGCTVSKCPDFEISMICYDYFLNNSMFLEGSKLQNHRASGNIYFANSWPMTFALPQLAEAAYSAFSTNRMTLTFPGNTLTVPDVLWQYTVNNVPMNSIQNVTLRLTQDIQFSDTLTVPEGRNYSLDSQGFTLSHADCFDGALFSICGILNLDKATISTGEASKPLATLDGGILTDSDDPNLTGYLHYSGTETGLAAGWQASYGSDGRMLSFAPIGTFDLTMPGIYLANPVPTARAASVIKQFLLDPVSFAPVSAPILP